MLGLSLNALHCTIVLFVCSEHKRGKRRHLQQMINYFVQARITVYFLRQSTKAFMSQSTGRGTTSANKLALLADIFMGGSTVNCSLRKAIFFFDFNLIFKNPIFLFRFLVYVRLKDMSAKNASLIYLLRAPKRKHLKKILFPYI